MDDNNDRKKSGAEIYSRFEGLGMPLVKLRDFEAPEVNPRNRIRASLGYLSYPGILDFIRRVISVAPSIYLEGAFNTFNIEVIERPKRSGRIKVLLVMTFRTPRTFRL